LRLCPTQDLSLFSLRWFSKTVELCSLVLRLLGTGLIRVLWVCM